MKLKTFALPTMCAVLASMGLASQAHAGALTVPIPANAYITFGGLQWAWAIPLPYSTSPNALDYQATQGWRLPTEAELAAAPLATDFLKADGNVPFNGTDPLTGSQFQATNASYEAVGSAGACAAAYFFSPYSHCDWQDGNGQVYAPWAGTPGAFGFADQLFVRDGLGTPEPTTWALLIGGFAFVGAVMRRRQAAATVTYA